MGQYYIVACHDCKQQSMLPKCPLETAQTWYKEWRKLHLDHETELSHDYDDDFYDDISGYTSVPSVSFID